MQLPKEAIEHAVEEYPCESCGVVVDNDGEYLYLRCNNISKKPLDEFILDPDDLASIEDDYEVVGVVHSHPDESCLPSTADTLSHKHSGYAWWIIGLPDGVTPEVNFMPAVDRPPLYGRAFVHGITDCYTFIRDYYAVVLNTPLPDFYRADDWWKNGDNLYTDNFEKAGFVKVDSSDLRPNDVILVAINADVPNHGAVYLGNNLIGHHLFGRPSERSIYGRYFKERTTHVLRYEKNN